MDPASSSIRAGAYSNSHIARIALFTFGAVGLKYRSEVVVNTIVLDI